MSDETATATTTGGAAADGGRTAERRSRGRLASVAWHLAALALLAVILYPLVWVVGAAFKPSGDIVGSTQLLPTRPVLDNLQRAMEGIAGISALVFLRNSLVLAGASVVGTVVSSALAAYAFARLRFRGRGLMFVLMITTLLLPFHVLIIPQYIIFQQAGLVDTYAPLLLGKFLATEAFFVFLMVQFMRQLPRELDQAARIDGCGYWGIFWHVVVPLSRPAFTTAAIFTFIWTWNDLLAPLIYLNTPEKYPVTLALRLFIDQTATSDYGAMIAMSVIALLPVVLFFLAFQRLLVQGMATSGLKG
ncbi:multiple sugar transport system permease protein [Spinactinospora alkalitolerans]|uniref:Multiple sugar transport system permease protein n=1 Tax=Spinactinospora alkalitolerans TaxID=687207 RepID=A0A852TV49_9ACTN|nr:carbohydrate ABC transporter permease [Spinactinospora alkalitolerans]NYE46752.1 multiple sugar transport system permease protein [Spinactinospora alkalitolerans]